MNNSTSIKKCLTHILNELQKGATRQNFKGHSLASFIRNNLKKEISTAVTLNHPRFRIKTSAGTGQWATVVWGAVFDPIITSTATSGYYLVYLFDASGKKVFLSLNQGTTAVNHEFGAEANVVLRERASFIRKRLNKNLSKNMTDTIKLGSDLGLPLSYEAGHATGYAYDFENMPSESQLLADLAELCKLYTILTFRGGLSILTEDEDVANQSGQKNGKKLKEKRQYSYHKRIDRSSGLSKKIKEKKRVSL